MSKHVFDRFLVPKSRFELAQNVLQWTRRQSIYFSFSLQNGSELGLVDLAFHGSISSYKFHVKGH